MIDVAHDRDHRRPRREVLLTVVHDLRLVVVRGVLDHDLALDLAGDELTSSSESDWVAVRICPRFMRILMIWGIDTPSACERSLTVTPDSTVTGPVGGATGCCVRAGAERSRA